MGKTEKQREKERQTLIKLVKYRLVQSVVDTLDKDERQNLLRRMKVVPKGSEKQQLLQLVRCMLKDQNNQKIVIEAKRSGIDHQVEASQVCSLGMDEIACHLAEDLNSYSDQVLMVLHEGLFGFAPSQASGGTVTQQKRKRSGHINDVLKQLITKFIAGLDFSQVRMVYRLLKKNPIANEAMLRVRLSNALFEDQSARQLAARFHLVGPELLTNDYYPENLDEIKDNQSKLEQIRRARVEALKTPTHFKLKPDNVPDNPLFDNGQEWIDSLREVKMSNCLTCENKWYMDVTPRTQKCARCANEKLAPGVPATFSRENNMHPGKQPTCLAVLNTIEAAAISMIIVITKIYRHKGGGLSLQGHSISFHQDIQELVTVLPRAPDQLGFVLIRGPGDAPPLKANKYHMLNALEWLKQNNEDYKDIEICEVSTTTIF